VTATLPPLSVLWPWPVEARIARAPNPNPGGNPSASGQQQLLQREPLLKSSSGWLAGWKENLAGAVGVGGGVGQPIDREKK
jgi:hypothetical protein